MVISTIVAFFLALFLLQIAVIAAIMRILAKWRGGPELSFRRAAMIGAALAIVALGLQLLIFWIAARSDIAEVSLPAVAGIWAGVFLVLLVLSKQLLNVGWKRAAVVGVGSLVLASVVMLGITTMVRILFFDTFVSPSGGMATTILGHHIDATCVNCQYTFAIGTRADDGLRRTEYVNCPMCGEGIEIARDVKNQRGDRILALKQGQPERWDVTVFDLPEDPSVRYIKRLVGLPGETIEIAGGEVFADSQMLRKHPQTLQELWLPVHDSKYSSATAGPDGARWRSADETKEHWIASDGSWKFNGKSEAALRFIGQIDDQLPYNAQARVPDHAHVGNIRLELSLSAIQENSSVAVRWKFGQNSVIAARHCDGSIELEAATPTGTSKRASIAPQAPAADESEVQIVFAVRDGAVYMFVNNDQAAELEFGSVSPSELRASYPRVGGELSIVARDAPFSIDRLILHRDIYYGSIDDMGGLDLVDRRPPYRLMEDEYFLLGDNSRMSRDCRFLGPIKRGALDGVVLCRYWP